jgi:hypothetical protein
VLEEGAEIGGLALRSGGVAAIEGIGSKLTDLHRCRECGSRVGSGERFRRALALVLPEEEASALAKSYKPRSGTVHSGKLHGTEARVGALAFPAFLTEDPVDDFVMRLLYKMRKASRALLTLALTGSLPAKS